MRSVIRWSPVHGRKVLSALLFLTVAAMGYACSDSTGPSTAQIKIQLTDAAADAIASAIVTISGVYLQACPEGEGTEGEGCEAEWQALELDGGAMTREIDLITLQDGVTADLTESETVEAQVYHQLRLVVDHATVTLKPDYRFEDSQDWGGTAELTVPSGYTSGIKVQLNRAIDLTNADLTTILVDFDLEQNFVLQGSEMDPVIKGVIFTPTLKEKERSQQQG